MNVFLYVILYECIFVSFCMDEVWIVSKNCIVHNNSHQIYVNKQAVPTSLLGPLYHTISWTLHHLLYLLSISHPYLTHQEPLLPGPLLLSLPLSLHYLLLHRQNHSLIPETVLEQYLATISEGDPRASTLTVVARSHYFIDHPSASLLDLLHIGWDPLSLHHLL